MAGMFGLRPPVSAVSPGLTVSPGFVDLKLSEAQPQAQASITLTNTYTVPLRLSAELQAIDEAGGRLLPSGTLDGALTEVLAMSETDITIPAHGAHTITLAANQQDSLSPGGHYAILLLTQQSANGTQIGLKGAASVTVFLTQATGEHQDLHLDSLRYDRTIFRLPRHARIVLNNTGNTHTVPRVVAALRHGDTLLAKGIANQSSQVLLPGKTLDAAIELDSLSGRWLPGRVRLGVTYRGDTGPEERQVLETFWYVPPVFVAGCAVLMVMALVAAWLGRTYRRTLQRWAAGLHTWLVQRIRHKLVARPRPVQMPKPLPSKKPQTVQRPMAPDVRPGNQKLK